MLELKATLNLPQTKFPMKANLPQNEPKMLARWEELRLYERIRQARQGAPLYVLHDGPPYANGPIHLGTAMNKSLKDFVVKSKSMAGFNSPYVPGWDCHGLPIEIKVDKELGGKKLKMDPLEVRDACRKYAEKYLNLQREQFKRLGVLGQWEKPYSTMTPEYEAMVVRTLFDFMEKGAVYKGLRPVYWCIHDRTALAEAEVEYANHTSPSVWVKYRMQSDPRTVDEKLADTRISFGHPVNVIIWTTTPWTLPASLAIAFHPAETYVALDDGKEIYIVAEKRAEDVRQKCGLQDAKVVAQFPGRVLEHAYFYHPFLPWPERKVLGVLADYVTMDQGTGAVHTAPSHGADDFYTGVKYKLDQTCNIDSAGRFIEGLPEYKGKTVFQANSDIVVLLRERGVLMHDEKIEHSYPHCWRCHNPVIFRATQQWFIAMEAEMWGTTFRKRCMEEVSKVKWDPAWGETRMGNMVAERPDWCISRQRLWGVPIAVFFCEGCGEQLNTAEAHKAVVELFAREGADSWYRHDAEAILPKGATCPSCQGSKFRKEMDIIDVWFEAGSSNLVVLGSRPDLPWPSDMYLEGGDQYRGWFQASLLCAVGAKGGSPYREVLTPGWTLDEQGRAQHKSLGNDVDPVDIANRLGGEIVRLWVASVDFREDVVGSENLMQRIADNYRKMRNTFRFLLSNLYDFEPERDTVAFADMQPLDQYALVKTADLTDEVRGWYSAYLFHKIYHRVLDYCVVDLSNTYLDVLKDRLYTSATNSRARRSAQTAIWRICETMVRLVAPIMSFTADEIWQYMPAAPGRPESVHLALFPDRAEVIGCPAEDAGLAGSRQDLEGLMKVRDEVLKALEEARNGKLIGSGLEAKVTISAPQTSYELLERYRDLLRYLFIVSAVEVQRGPDTNGSSGIKVEISRAPGQKCERCWNYSTRVGEDSQYPTVCERCSAVLKELELSR